MDSLVSADGRYEIVLTDDFDGMMERLVGAHQVARFAVCATQLYASWIVYNSLWAESTDDYYVDHRNGDIYSDFDNAPEDVQPSLMLRHKRTFPTQTEFFNYLQVKIPDFNVSTFWARHRTVLKRVELWRKAHANTANMPEDVFLDIIQDIVLYGRLIDDVVISGVFKISKAKRGEPSEIKALSDKANLESLGIDEDIKPDETMQKVAVAVLETIEDAHDQVRAGARVQTVVSDLRSELFNESSIYFNTRGSEIMFNYTPANGGDIIPTQRYVVKFIDQNGEVLSATDFNPEVIEWLERHLRVTIRGWRQ